MLNGPEDLLRVILEYPMRGWRGSRVLGACALLDAGSIDSLEIILIAPVKAFASSLSSMI